MEITAAGDRDGESERAIRAYREQVILITREDEAAAAASEVDDCAADGIGGVSRGAIRSTRREGEQR